MTPTAGHVYVTDTQNVVPANAVGNQVDFVFPPGTQLVEGDRFVNRVDQKSYVYGPDPTTRPARRSSGSNCPPSTTPTCRSHRARCPRTRSPAKRPTRSRGPRRSATSSCPRPDKRMFVRVNDPSAAPWTDITAAFFGGAVPAGITDMASLQADATHGEAAKRAAGDPPMAQGEYIDIGTIDARWDGTDWVVARTQAAPGEIWEEVDVGARGTVTYVTDTCPPPRSRSANNWGFGVAATVEPDPVALEPEPGDVWIMQPNGHVGAFT